MSYTRPGDSSATQQGSFAVEVALDEALQDVVDQSGRSVHGWSYSVNRVQDVVFPRDLFLAQPMDLATGASYFKLPQGALGRARGLRDRAEVTALSRRV